MLRKLLWYNELLTAGYTPILPRELRATSTRLQRVSFWTTPDGGGPGQNVAYPFAVEAFLPAPPP